MAMICHIAVLYFRSVECSKDELASAMEQYVQYATDDFGVLCLLYSIILTAVSIY